MEANRLEPPHVHRFSHNAMNTTFSLRFVHQDPGYAAQLAAHSIEIIDRIEQHLSRYLPASEVSQINQLAAGESLILSELCYNCLQKGFQAYQATGGRFDITLGRQIDLMKSGQSLPSAPEQIGQFALAPDRPQIHCIQAGKLIDLGGLGKGFALDQVHANLRQLNCGSALLSAGASTHFAIGEQTWPIQLKGQCIDVTLPLQQAAISASGFAEQGNHIVSVLEPEHQAVYPRVWFVAKTACDADIWSTTAMLMDAAECQALLDEECPLILDSPILSPWLQRQLRL